MTGLLNLGEPISVFFNLAIRHSKETILQRAGDFARLADDAAVNAADGRKFGSRAGHEHLVGNVEVAAREAFLNSRNLQVIGQAENRVARDAFQQTVGQRRRGQHTISHDEQVLARAFAHKTRLVQHCLLYTSEHLAEFAASKGVEFFYSTPGVQLIKDDSGRVTGVVGKDGNKFIKFNATKGVILSTGDYQNNQSLVERYCPDVKEFDRKQNNKTGDGILMSMAAGAGLVPVGHAHMMHDFDSGPMFNEPFLMVNENGERFMNEDCVFEEVNCCLLYTSRCV